MFAHLTERPLRYHVPALSVIAAAVLAIYWWGIWYPSLGSELALFYSIAHDKTFSQVLGEYVNFGSVLWYRPTSFYLPYWIGETFLDWHNVAGWKLFQIVVLIPSCWAVYLLTQLLFRGERLAGVLAALYLAIYPGCISVVMQNSAFDAPHILFVILTVTLFCCAQLAGGWKKVLLTALAALAFLGALTSKELTVVAPVYLAGVSLLVLLYERRRQPIWKHALTHAVSLVPFYGLLGAYYLLQFRRMPVYEKTGTYRTVLNLDIVWENLTNFPLWVMRLFGILTDFSGQSAGLVHALNITIGLAVLMLVVAYWLPEVLLRREMRFKACLLVLWIAVFLSVPVYSGRTLWHVDLAVCGYAVLAGVSIAYWIHRIAPKHLRCTVTALVVVGFVAVGVSSCRDTLLSGMFTISYRVGAQLLQKLPVPATDMPPDALIFIEDRLGLTPWFYGGQALFRYAYLKPTLREKAVPAMDRVPIELRAQWLSNKHAFFFRYDDQFNWYDDSARFRAESLRRLMGTP